MNSQGKINQHELGPCRGAVADAKPGHLWWTTTQGASFGKVGVFRDYGETMVYGILPNPVV